MCSFPINTAPGICLPGRLDRIKLSNSGPHAKDAHMCTLKILNRRRCKDRCWRRRRRIIVGSRVCTARNQSSTQYEEKNIKHNSILLDHRFGIPAGSIPASQAECLSAVRSPSGRHLCDKLYSLPSPCLTYNPGSKQKKSGVTESFTLTAIGRFYTSPIYRREGQ